MSLMPYRSPKRLADVTNGLFIVFIGMTIVVLCLVFVASFLPDGRKLGSDGAGFRVALTAISVFGTIGGVAWVGLVVSFLMWLFRCYKNLDALEARGSKYTAGWAVAVWFIPFLCVYMPFQAVRDLWNESDPDYDPQAPMFAMEGGAPGMISAWWATFLIYNFLSRILNAAGRTFETAFSTPAMISACLVTIFSVTAAVLAIRIVRGITARQEARYVAVTQFADSRFEPPPPPQFNQETESIVPTAN